MDRYQFEDLISQYLENSLSLSQRKSFEDYLKHHPESQRQVDSMRDMLRRMKRLNRIGTSPDFTANLKARLAHTNASLAYETEKKTRYFGLSPLYATALVAMVVGVILTGLQFFPLNTGQGGSFPASSMQMASESSVPVYNGAVSKSQNEPILVDVEDDTVFDKAKQKNENIDLGNRVQFVKDSPR